MNKSLKNFIFKSLLVICFFALNTISSLNKRQKMILRFERKFHKKYLSKKEEEYRSKVLSENMKKMEENNKDGLKTFKMNMNEFSDLTFKEFESKFLNHKMRDDVKKGKSKNLKLNPKLEQNKLSASEQALLESSNQFFKSNRKFDWREVTGAVNPIKNQGSCGSCYAFSANASLENAVYRKTKKSVSLSEQELVDCTDDSFYGNAKCEGGWMDFAYEYVYFDDILTENDYPYTGNTQNCRKNSILANKANVETHTVWGIKKSDYSGEDYVEQLKKLVYQGVVAVAFEARFDFINYSDGIYDPKDTTCGFGLNHAVNVVGLNLDGDDGTGKNPYFIIRNSWGSTWGINGYAKVALGSDFGTCGIADPIGVTLPFA